eukprot:GHVN01059513.1.p2 GENE.GHVN01059513.1~~GHVN01059513.1.p2  ORF type:complete len:175 (-),score=3.32 GHVN01059513.1:671-1195(-)
MGFPRLRRRASLHVMPQVNLFSFKFVHPDFAERRVVPFKHKHKLVSRSTQFERGDIDTLAQKLHFQDIEPDVSIQASFQSNAEGPHGPAYSLASRSCTNGGLSHVPIRSLVRVGNKLNCLFRFVTTSDQFNFEGRMLVTQSSRPSKAQAGFVFGFKDPATYLLLEFDGAEFFEI